MSEVKTAPTKLVDLNPSWFSIHGRDSEGAGVMFDCPCKSDSCVWGGRIAIAFSNPFRGEPSSAPGERHWQRTGDTFETLSLSPSINAVGHWHGFLRNGVLVSC